MMKRLVLALLVTLIALGLWWTVPWRSGEEGTTSASPSIPLGLKGPAVALAQTGSTFPADEAGLAAYLRVSPLSMEKVLPAFDHWEHYGNWVKGYILVKLYPDWHSSFSNLSVEVTVYVDSQGWVVAYLHKNYAPANIMVWTGVTQGASNLPSIGTTALEEALKKVLLAAGVDFASVQGQVLYYHFQYPAAKSIGIWAKVGSLAQGQEASFKLSIVNGATIYSESVFVLAGYNVGASGGWWYEYEARARGYAQGNGVPFAWELGTNKMSAGLDYSYSVLNRFSSGNQTLGIAVVLIYTLP